jgi:hypothetical protein
MTPLRFANPSPPSGWIEDFHLQAVDHARHTEQSPAKDGRARLGRFGQLLGCGGTARNASTVINLRHIEFATLIWINSERRSYSRIGSSQRDMLDEESFE